MWCQNKNTEYFQAGADMSSEADSDMQVFLPVDARSTLFWARILPGMDYKDNDDDYGDDDEYDDRHEQRQSLING